MNSVPVNTVSKVMWILVLQLIHNLQSLTFIFFLITENYMSEYTTNKSIKPTPFLFLWLDSCGIATHKLYPIGNFTCLEEPREKLGQKLKRTVLCTLHLALIQWFSLYLQSPIKLSIKVTDIKDGIIIKIHLKDMLPLRKMLF